MFDDLQENLSSLGKRIRSIWIADVAHQGQSGVINEDALGNDRMFAIQELLDSTDRASQLVGLRARSSFLDQSKTRRNASASCGNWPQYGGHPIVRLIIKRSALLADCS